MAAGALDARGVWIYGEDDPLSPFSAFMNLGQQSISDLLLRTPRGILPNGAVSLLANSTVNATTAIGTTPVDVPGLSCAVTVGTSRRIKLVFDGMLFSSVASDRAQVGIREGSTLLDYTMVNLTTLVTGAGAHVECLLAPTPGAHTYKISIGRHAGTGTVNVLGGATTPAVFYVEDVGTTL